MRAGETLWPSDCSEESVGSHLGLFLLAARNFLQYLKRADVW